MKILILGILTHIAPLIPAKPEHYGTVGHEAFSPSSQTVLWYDFKRAQLPEKPLSQKGEISHGISRGPITFP